MKQKKMIAISSLGFLTAIWFVAVDWSWFVFECHDCGCFKDVLQYRVFEIPVHETVLEHQSVTQRVGIDLGVPCPHGRKEYWHKHRRRGLCICADPCINGLYRLAADDGWYTDGVSTKIAALALKEPHFKSEYSKRVLQEHQYEFVKTILEKAGAY